MLCILLQDCVHPPYHVDLQTIVCGASSDNTCDWMNALVQRHPDAALVDICLPGSHDAGMYVTQHCSIFATQGNTSTQYLPMKQQLEAGLRIFDIRPVLYHGEFYTEHVTHCDGLGCMGDRLLTMITAARDFVDAHHELVIILLTHDCHTTGTDSALLTLLTRTLGDRIYKETTAPSGKLLIQTPIRQLVPADSRSGKVLLLLEGAPKTAEARAQGFFITDELHGAGGWSNDNMYPLLREHQVKRFADYPGNGSTMYELAWQITQHNEQALRSSLAPHGRVAIRNGAYHVNQHLTPMLDSLIAAGAIHRGKIPNILWSDCADTMVTHQCMRLSRIGVE